MRNRSYPIPRIAPSGRSVVVQSAGGGVLGITPVAQTSVGSPDANNATTPAVDTTGANFLALVVSSIGAAASVAITDSKGNTWVARTEYGSSNPKVRLYYVEGATVGTGHTFSVTSSSSFPSISVAAFSGVLTASAFDLENGAAATAPGSITPSEDNELIITGAAAASGEPSAIDSGFTLLETEPLVGGQSFAVGLAYKVQTTAAAVNPTWTMGTLGGTTIASFKAA